MTRFRPSPGVHAATDRDGAVLLHVPRGLLYGLNPTATALWEHISGGTDLRDPVETLAVRWGVDPDRLRADALALTDDLARLGLLSPMQEER